MYTNTELCSKCGGRCCMSLSGTCFPSDFGLPGSFSRLDSALRSGRYTIDWWEGDPRTGKDDLNRAFFVRPATKGHEGKRYDPSWGGTCTFLTSTGCKLHANSRPLSCQYLEPQQDTQCLTRENMGKQTAAIKWLPFHERLRYQ